MAVEREILIEQTGTPEGMKISWGGVFGGVLAGVGTLLLLTSLGLAVGISAVDPRDTDAGTVGMGAAIWTTLSLLISLFVAGWASTRLSMLWERTTAMFEGALVWVLSLILILYLTANGIGLVASGAFGVLESAAQGASSGMASAPDATRTDPSQAASEAQRDLADLAARARQNLPQQAAAMKPEATTTAWLTFAALVLSLVASVAGAAVGRRNVERRIAPDMPR